LQPQLHAKIIVLRDREANMRSRAWKARKEKSEQTKVEEGGGWEAHISSGAKATSTRAILLESETDVRAHRCIGRPPPAGFLPLACRVGGNFVISRYEKRRRTIRCVDGSSSRARKNDRAEDL